MNRTIAVLMFASMAFSLPATGQPAAPDQAVPLNIAKADEFAGYYRLNQAAIRFWREGDQFYFGTVGTPQRVQLTVEAENRFALPKNMAPVVITFNPDASGHVVEATMNQAGREFTVPRIDQATALALQPRAAAPPVARTWKVVLNTPKFITPETSGTMDYWPCFSPDGKIVLFSRTLDAGKSWTLFKVDAGGGAAQAFAALPVSATRAAWSAKTGKITFNGDAAGKTAIWVMNADGSGAHPIVTGDLYAPGYPSWYPDGSLAVGDAARNILYRVTEGGKPVAITDQAQVLTGMSSVSPDGKWIAFAGQKDVGQAYDQNQNQIWLTDGNGPAKPLEAAPLPGRTPSWSPDGTKLAFESDRGSPDHHYAIFVINRDGTGLTQVTDYALNGSHPVWAPDGRRLVFATGDPARNISVLAVVEVPAAL